MTAAPRAAPTTHPAPPIDPPPDTTVAAREAVDDWLSLIDAGSYAAAHDTASGILRENVTRDEFATVYEEARSLVGTVRSRVFRGATRTITVPGAPPGDYVVFEFDADYERKANALERVTVADDAKVWRVAGHWVLDAVLMATETALAHVKTNAIETAYRRTDMLEWRRALMEQWAAFLAGGDGPV
ncbi:MAG: DUF4019 domain-containing protein [Acidobacteria bacterium]|nr:DUF4019 domain-containing protein [Acidobacteriota bacterium]